MEDVAHQAINVAKQATYQGVFPRPPAFCWKITNSDAGEKETAWPEKSHD
jgi:hypothetical protein